jgi:hypothetical protein
MARCFFFNLKLLPVNGATKGINSFAGVDGYKKLFRRLDNQITTQQANQTLHESGIELPRSDFYFVTTKVSFEKTYIHCKFRKFDKADNIKAFYSDKELYKVPKDTPAINKSWNFTAIFDPKTHTLLIEDSSQKLPAPSTIEDILTKIFEPIVEMDFPKHVFECIVLKQKSALEKVTSAKKYKSIDISISYSNPIDSEEELEGLIDRENAEAGIKTLKVSQRPAQGGLINRLPNYTKALLKLAGRQGDAAIKYFDENTKRWSDFKFKMWPVKISVRLNKESPSAHRLNLFSKIADAIKQSSNE